MSSTKISKRPTTPKTQLSRSRLQSKEDVCVERNLPPSIEGPVYAILIFHVPKLRWLPKHQPLYQSPTIKVIWWGAKNTSAVFKPQMSDTAPDHRQQPSITAKYYIRCDLKQFSKYLTDAAELVLKVIDTDTNRIIGTVKIQNLSTLSINNTIKGYHPIFSNKGDKLGELFVALRLFLPGPHDSSENITALSFTSDTSMLSARHNSITTNDYNHDAQLENGLQTYTLDGSLDTEQKNHRNKSKNVAPGMQAYKELPTGEVVEELIERANRLRKNMIKSSSERTTTIKKNSQLNESTSHDMLINEIDHSVDNENIYDSVITDLDGLENEQSLLDELLYGESTANNHLHNNNKKHRRRSSSTNKRNSSNGKPPIDRSRSPSMTRVSRSSTRSRSRARSQSLTRSNNSDSPSRISLDIQNSDVDHSGNETHDEDELSNERIHLLNQVRTARLRIDHLRLNILHNCESPTHSSFGRTNKSKRAITYYIEYQFPVIINNLNGHLTEATEVMKITSKHFESNNDIIFSHLSTYPCLFNQTNLQIWSRSSLIFKIYSRVSGTTNPEQIGFVVLPLENILKAPYLHFEDDLNVIDRTQFNNHQKISNKITKKFSIGQLHLMLELDSDEKDFKSELDQIQLIEEIKPKKPRVSKSKRIKKSKKSSMNTDNSLINSKSFLTNESTDDLVVQIYLSITEARNLRSLSNNNQPVRNPYIVCRAFWNEEPITSVVCWGNLTPRFNFQQKIPLLLTKSAIEKMHQNFVIIELWDKKLAGSSDQLIGISKIPLEQFYASFQDKQISHVLLRAQYPVISIDSWLPIINPFTSANKSIGEIQVLLAIGTSDQITALQVAHVGGDRIPSVTTINQDISTISNTNQSLCSSLIEHHFEIMIEGINNLRAFESMIWGESDCFIQYLFPTQQEQKSTNTNPIKPFELRTIRTATTLCTSDPTFHDTNSFRYILPPTDALHKYFYAACQSTIPLETSIQFEVWSRFYYPNTRDQLLAQGKLPAVKLCSMTTMLNADNDEKSLQSFRVPLEIVREDPEHKHYHQSTAPSSYAGDLLLTVTYKRNIIKQNDTQTISSDLSANNSQVSISIDIIRACGLKYATIIQARNDSRFNYPCEVGVNTYAKLTFSFLSDIESRSTKTISRSFIPEYNFSIHFPLSLIWNNHQNQSISLAEMLEHGELKIEIYHQMNIDILLCYSIISLKDLVTKHTGIKGWYPLSSANSTVSSDYVSGIELSIRFTQQDDRRRMIDSAKQLGWLNTTFIDEENFFDHQKNVGSLVKISIDRIQFPNHLLTQSNKDHINIYAQYRFYDKMPIVTKRKKAIMEKNHLICQLAFNKEHLFLYSLPFIRYIQEEKLEIEIWTSENEVYDYSQSFRSATDQLMGSIYIDLSLLLNKKGKFNRLNLTLPMFKQGIKDFHGASVEIQLTMDKINDFNQLRNHNNIDTSNDIEFDAYVESHYSDLTNKIPDNIFSVVINIEQAAHLPDIYSEEENMHIPPNPYVTYSTSDSPHFYHTQVIKSIKRPVWNYQELIQLSVEYLSNDKKRFVLKVSHKTNTDIETISERSRDEILGLVSIDLSPLISGLQQISGWYNILDTIGNIQGQLKVTVVPQEDLYPFKAMKYNSKSTNDTYRSSSIISHDLSSRTNTTGEISLNSLRIDDENNKQSFLMTNLRRQLGELDVITERLKARYHSKSDISSDTNRSTLTNKYEQDSSIWSNGYNTPNYLSTGIPSIHHHSTIISPLLHLENLE